jgi:hypothetical protein
MKRAISLTAIVLLVLSLGLTLGSCEQKEVSETTPPSPAPDEYIDTNPPALEGPGAKMACYYQPESLSVSPQVPGYQLPLNLAQVSNYPELTSKLNIKGAETLLKNNGFVVIDYGWVDDIVKPYKDMKGREVPIFVTSDTLLHLYHIQFDETLKDIEEKEFFEQIKSISKVMLEDSEIKYSTLTGDSKEAARRNTAYFALGLKLLDSTADIPDFIEQEVSSDLARIEAHSGFLESAIFKYKEDFSQYIPRGHYTRSETLKKYFKAMMWYGRIGFLLKGCPISCFLSEEDAKIQTLGASLIATSLDEVKVEEKTVRELWERIYSVTAFYVGLADDLTPHEYLTSIIKVYGSSFPIAELGDEDKLLSLKAELATLRLPEIYGGTGSCEIYLPFTPEKVNQCLDNSKGMRFMGQRFIPDSYIFQNLVFPKAKEYTGSEEPFTMCLVGDSPVPERCFPRGLDVMALLGSSRAGQILADEGDTEYENYANQFNELTTLFNSFNETNWNKNLYWGWLYSLKSLLKEFPEGYPTFMQTGSWQSKELNSALASWTELRHDTILYAKQSYTPIGITSVGLPPPKPVVGYVEPVPEFYSRLLALTRMTDRGLTDMGVLDSVAKNRLQSLEGILVRLISISIDELENKELTEEDYQFIRNFGEQLESVVLGVEETGTKTTLIADVHTDGNTQMVLEEGVGYVELILVAYKVPDGRIIIGAGPVMSYYEFKWPMSDRLTDEKWREMLGSGSEPGKPAWTEVFAF